MFLECMCNALAQDYHMQVENLNCFLEIFETRGDNRLRFGWPDFRIQACWTKLKAERYGASFRWSFLQEDTWVQVGLYLKDHKRSLLILSFYP